MTETPVPKTFQVFRVIVSLMALAVLVQSFTAALLLSSSSGRAIHGGFATVVFLLALLQVVFAILTWRPGGMPARFIGPSVGVLIATVVQVGAGMAKVKVLHLPLGVLMFGGMMMLAVQLWSSRAPRTPRPSEMTATA